MALLLIDKLKLDAQKYDIAANKSLDNLIRTNKITYIMATSLMNDTTYAYTIVTELTKVAQTLFVHTNTEGTHSKEALLLNENELSSIYIQLHKGTLMSTSKFIERMKELFGIFPETEEHKKKKTIKELILKLKLRRIQLKKSCAMKPIF